MISLAIMFGVIILVGTIITFVYDITVWLWNQRKRVKN